MTDRIESSESVPEPLHAIVEAFLDGEVVDPTMLRTALADGGARDHFVDLLIIRRALQRMDSPAMSAASTSHGSRSRAKWFAGAAAAMLVSLTAGYFAGQRVMASTAAPSTVEAAVVVESPLAAPKPTRSITLKPGLNWTDSSGGQ